MLFSIMVALLVSPAQAPSTATPRPTWVETLPEAPGRLYALGTADLGGNAGQAITRASDRARLEVVSRLRASVQGRTSVMTRTSELQGQGGKALGYGERRVQDDVSVTARAEDLPGLVVERTFADPQGGTAYALAYLDLAQAGTALASRLANLQEARARVPEELTRQARWRLRRIKGDLDRLDESITLLSLTGTGLNLRMALQQERNLLEARLSDLAKATLPPVDFSKIAMGFRSNVDLPQGIEGYLAAQIGVCGLIHRDLGPDLLLELTFTGGKGAPEFIFADLDIYQGVTYRLDAQLKLLEAGGTALGRPSSIQIIQSSSPEGMVEAFRREFERRLPKLLAAFNKELQ
jgi:hypothetical protein